MGNSKSTQMKNTGKTTGDRKETFSESDEDLLEINECTTEDLRKEPFIPAVCCAHRCRDERNIPVCEFKDCKYVKITELTLDKLPPELREESLLNYLQVQEKLVVQLKVGELSPLRRAQQGISCSTGTGYVWLSKDTMETIERCPLKNCNFNNGQSHKAYGSLIVYTNKHVVQDDFEAQHCEVDFFYNDFSQQAATSELSIQAQCNDSDSDRGPMLLPVSGVDNADQVAKDTETTLAVSPAVDNADTQNAETAVPPAPESPSSEISFTHAGLESNNESSGDLNHDLVSRETQSFEGRNNTSAASASSTEKQSGQNNISDNAGDAKLPVREINSVNSEGKGHWTKTEGVNARNGKNGPLTLCGVSDSSYWVPEGHLVTQWVESITSEDVSKLPMLRAYGYCLRENRDNKDLIGMRLIFHHPQLYDLVCHFSKQRQSCWNKIPSDLKFKMKQHVVVIAHPHGGPKRISFGNLLSLEKKNDKEQKVTTYNAATCKGSSGAPVLTGYYPNRPFTHSRKNGRRHVQDAAHLEKHINKSLSY